MPKDFVRKSFEQILDTGLTGITLRQVGDTFVGNLSGIGGATQSLLGAGAIGRTIDRFKLFK